MTEPSIFTQYINKRQSLVKNKKVLQSSYIPNNLPHRSNEINSIVEIIAPSLNKDKPSNILIYGKTGTGKTAVMNYIGKELRKADPTQENCCFIYMNCEVVGTPYGILHNISDQIISDPDKKIPYTGLSLEKIFKDLKDIIDSQNRIFIVVLDEIDRSFQTNGDDILYRLTTINDPVDGSSNTSETESLKNSKLSIIGITNNAKFTEFLSPKVKSRLGEEKIIFPPYSSKQLQDILYERAKDAFDEGILDEDVIPHCAAISAKDTGDARMALDLLRMAADVAERNGDKKITGAHVKYAKSKIELDAVNEIVKTLTSQSKIVLMSIIKNTENDMTTMTTGDVYSTYKVICEVVGYTILTQRRIADLISELDMLGIVHARVKSFGRAGRTKEIELAIPKDVINLVKSDDIFKNMGNYKPQTQTTLI